MLEEVKNLSKCSSILAELWAVFLGLHLAWECGYTNIIFLETDSLMVVGILSDNNQFRNTNLVLLQKCKDLVLRGWNV